MSAVSPNKPRTKNRVVRVPDDLWDAAKTAAASNGETVSDVIRRALREYVDRPDDDADPD